MPPNATDEGEWEYEVQSQGVSYWVVITDSLSVQSVARIVPIEGTERRARSIIWHKGHSRMTREASRAIQAARIIERRTSTEDLRARIAAKPEAFGFLSKDELFQILEEKTGP